VASGGKFLIVIVIIIIIIIEAFVKRLLHGYLTGASNMSTSMDDLR